MTKNKKKINKNKKIKTNKRPSIINWLVLTILQHIFLRVSNDKNKVFNNYRHIFLLFRLNVERIPRKKYELTWL